MKHAFIFSYGIYKLLKAFRRAARLFKMNIEACFCKFKRSFVLFKLVRFNNNRVESFIVKNLLLCQPSKIFIAPAFFCSLASFLVWLAYSDHFIQLRHTSHSHHYMVGMAHTPCSELSNSYFSQATYPPLILSDFYYKTSRRKSQRKSQFSYILLQSNKTPIGNLLSLSLLYTSPASFGECISLIIS